MLLKLWMPKILCLFFTLLVLPEIRKEWCTRLPDIWSIQLIPSKMVSVTKTMMFIGVLPILVGLPGIPISFTDLCRMERQPFCLKEFLIIRIPDVFGKRLKNIRFLNFTQLQRPFALYQKKVLIG